MAINGTLTFPDVPGRISEHNSSTTAHSVRIENDLTNPTEGKAADAKATKDLVDNASGQIEEEIDDLNGEVTDLKSAITIGRLTPEIITALLACFEKVAWIDDDGQDYYGSLYDALYNVSSISAVYTQTNTVYETDSLDVLKTDLVVTAFYPDGSSEIVSSSSYTLSGTLTVGTSLITVSYGGKTTTFNVTVTNPFSDLTFESNTWATFGAGEYANYIKKSTASARARVSVPFANNNYTFVVTDTTKYNIAAYRVTSLETITVGQSELYPGDNNSSVSWGTSVSVDTQYVALAFKKLDNTDFTQNELDNMYGTVFVLG